MKREAVRVIYNCPKQKKQVETEGCCEDCPSFGGYHTSLSIECTYPKKTTPKKKKELTLGF